MAYCHNVDQGTRLAGREERKSVTRNTHVMIPYLAALVHGSGAHVPLVLMVCDLHHHRIIVL